MFTFRIIFLCFNILLFFNNFTQALFPNGPYPVVFIQSGQNNQVGGIQDVNNDGLLDFIIGYYQRDYNFVNTAIFLNDGCSFVHHIDPFQQISYCPQFFEQQRYLKFQADPPIATVTFENLNITRVMRLPYTEMEFVEKIRHLYGIEGVLSYTMGDVNVEYNSLGMGSSVTIGGGAVNPNILGGRSTSSLVSTNPITPQFPPNRG
ncbi:hypothetical protein ABK040_005270 [Willaertia magna]